MDTERFALSPRRFDPDRDWFGEEANPSRTINVPLIDPYLMEPDPAAPWYDTVQDAPETDATTLNHTLRKVHIMAGDTTITVIGNLTADPELKYSPSGSAVVNFTVASTPRTFDRQSNEWKDGETLFLRASVWREAAENVAESLTKGMRVIVSGRLKSRSYETKEGEKRTVVELEVEEVGASLRYSKAKVTRTQRSDNPAGQGAGGPGNQGAAQSVPQGDPWAAPQTMSGDGFWGGGPDAEPPF
ncbi:single-stranded DNA-binding protein [Arthrobacter bambusae]|uniref:single-stranded DNA-binding protein n=1 Tax=Arthrobacter bambusae TaxID=1338426 RepID=UPI0027876BE9|nr:single-stranded DNA-binding protein [Arthrobacter bambusae]MDQ0241409.1 single stranded DNA-binding protein [Arthrobacter bambusae]